LLHVVYARLDFIYLVEDVCPVVLQVIRSSRTDNALAAQHNAPHVQALIPTVQHVQYTTSNTPIHVSNSALSHSTPIP
jgi:hypothetical protein